MTLTPERLAELKALAEKFGPNEDRLRWFRAAELAEYLRRADASVTPDDDGALMAALDPQTVLALIAAAEGPFVVPAAGITDAEGRTFDFSDATARIEMVPSDTAALERERDKALAQMSALREGLELMLRYPGIKEYVGSETWRPAFDALDATAAAARSHDERIAKQVIEQTIRDAECNAWEYGNGSASKKALLVFADKLRGKLIRPPTAAEPQREGAE